MGRGGWLLTAHPGCVPISDQVRLTTQRMKAVSRAATHTANGATQKSRSRNRRGHSPRVGYAAKFAAVWFPVGGADPAESSGVAAGAKNKYLTSETGGGTHEGSDTRCQCNPQLWEGLWLDETHLSGQISCEIHDDLDVFLAVQSFGS